MAKLVFNYGAMGSSKTANALMVAYNYEERGQHALILKPATDTRDGIHTVSSRIGLSNTCRLIDEFLDEFIKSDGDVRELGIRNGDFVAVNPAFTVTEKGYIKSRFLDDKASASVLLACAK